jgi:hypothetical protein
LITWKFQRGHSVWERPLGPGKYAFNTYAGSIILVPTTNFVLHRITGKPEAHRYDDRLRSIDLVTKNANEPRCCLGLASWSFGIQLPPWRIATRGKHAGQRKRHQHGRQREAGRGIGGGDP